MPGVVSGGLVGLGVGGVARGSGEALVGRLKMPVDEVNLNTFLSVAAACSAKKILAGLPGADAVGVAVYARGDPGSGRVEYLEIEVEVLGRVEERDVVEALWSCPIMGFLRDKVRGVRVRVRAS